MTPSLAKLNRHAASILVNWRDKGGFVSSAVVHNDMHLESGTNLVLDDIEELPEFQGAMPAVNVFIKLDILTIDGIYFLRPLKVTRGAVASCPCTL